MAISFIGSASAGATNGNDATLVLPAHQAGDLIIIAYAIGDNDNVDFTMAIVSPTGYTKVADLFSNDTQDISLGVFWKIAGAGEANPVVDGLGGADASVTSVCMIFRGVDQTTPMDVTPTTATGIDTMHPDPPSIDFVTANSWVVIAGASGHTLGAPNSYTFPTGYTVDKIDLAISDTSSSTVGMGYRTGPADPEDPGVMTHSGTDSVNFAWCAATLALREAPPAAPYDSNNHTQMALMGIGH